jgi:hypothetical protein
VLCQVTQVFPEDARFTQLASPLVAEHRPFPQPLSAVTVESPMSRMEGAASAPTSRMVRKKSALGMDWMVDITLSSMRVRAVY